MAEMLRSKYEILRRHMTNERSSFEKHWKELGDYLLPRRIQLSTTETNKGDKRNQKIINNVALLAIRSMRSGMMAGITSPARPWFKLSTPEPGLADMTVVKEWLQIVSRRMTSVFLKSNLYNALPLLYADLGVFGNGALFVEEDFESTIRCTVFPTGSYAMANDEKGRPRVWMREFRLTVRQLVKKFGMTDMDTIDLSKLSTHVQSLYKNKQLDSWIDVIHIVHANNDYDPKSLASNKKEFRSVYYEKGSDTGGASSFTEDSSKFLSDKGYDYFPVLLPRWEVTGEDVYATNCPGMVALGDVIALQAMEKRKAQAIEKKVNPAMIGPTSLKKARASILPGDITYLDERTEMKGFRVAHEVDLQLGDLGAEIDRHEQRIIRSFYEDLFLMLASSDRREITAREIDERHEEKLLALGPVLEQLNQDLLDPLIDITFAIMAKQGMIPEPPEELAEQELKIEYISIMHQAQKLAGLAGIDRLLGMVGQVASFDPDVLDKIDLDQTIDEYGDITGVPSGIVRSDDVVDEIRANRAEAEAQARQMEKMQQGAAMAKDLAGADMSGDNALNALIQQSQAGAIN